MKCTRCDEAADGEYCPSCADLEAFIPETFHGLLCSCGNGVDAEEVQDASDAIDFYNKGWRITGEQAQCPNCAGSEK